MRSTSIWQQVGNALEQNPVIEWLADMSRTPYSPGTLFFPGRNMHSSWSFVVGYGNMEQITYCISCT